uniref:Uncharacterized protein n=1 Tax=Anopheles farauti TaxID=69004 RepID=A0A1Y9H9I8_9DIPT
MLFLPIVSIVLLIFFSASTVAGKYRCSIIHPMPIGSERTIFTPMERDVQQHADYEEVCIIANVNLNSTNYTTFPSYRSIELFYLSTPHIGPSVFQQLSEVTLNLELRKGFVGELVYGLSRLKNLKISDTGLYLFEVLPLYDETLQTLVIHERLITVLPSNLNFLTELKLLDLSGCSLTTIDISQLGSLSYLSVLNLADNQLASIETSTETDFPALVMIDVHQNALSRVDRFPEMFPALKFTRIMRNRWDCEWASAVREKIWTRNITVLGTDLLCGKRINNGGLCCTYAHPSRARLAIAKTLLSAIEDMIASATADAQTIEPLITLKVFENETVDGVIGVEMQNVGIYLQNPIGAV